MSAAAAFAVAAGIIAANLGFAAGCWWSGNFIQARIADHLRDLDERWREW